MPLRRPLQVLPQQAAALEAFSSARSVAFLPGTPFLGLLRSFCQQRQAASSMREIRVGGLCALAEPVLNALDVHLHALFAVFASSGVIGAELLDEATVAGHAAVVATIR